jgi:hypothetical protein|eukprot:COSAG01_NODE_1769_length_9272_cov_34.805298_6_plen_158_part_00
MAARRCYPPAGWRAAHVHTCTRMVALVAAATVEEQFETLGRGAGATTAQWGLLLGQAPSSVHSKAYVLAAVPTDATSGGGGDEAGDTADDLADHASQVARMLVGGVRVLGVYQYGPDGPKRAEEIHRTALKVCALSEPTDQAAGSEVHPLVPPVHVH